MNFCTVRRFTFMSPICEPRQKMLEGTTTILNSTSLNQDFLIFISFLPSVLPSFLPFVRLASLQILRSGSHPFYICSINSISLSPFLSNIYYSSLFPLVFRRFEFFLLGISGMYERRLFMTAYERHAFFTYILLLLEPQT
jgi:hypothetical protein